MTQSIMVVDDDHSIRDIVTEILRDEGYEAHGYADGLAALDALRRVAPVLIVLDMRMPALTGWEFVERMRARGHDIPILVMTAAQDARVWAEQVGAVGYIAKPFELDALVAAVARAVDAPGAGGASTLKACLPSPSRWRQHVAGLATRRTPLRVRLPLTTC